MEEPRQDGGRWYCSPSCLLQAGSGRSAKWKPRRKWHRRIGWTLGTVFVLFVGFVALGFLVGDPHNSGASVAAHSPVVVSNIGFSEDSGEIDYGLTLVNKSSTTDAVGLSVTVRAVDVLGRSAATDTTPISVIPAGGTFNLAGIMAPSVSLKVKKLRATVSVDGLHPKGERLPRVSGVKLDTSSGELL